MADSTVTYEEIRLTGLDSELTHCFVLCRAGGDSPIGVQGWHHKTFPASKSAVDILATLREDSPVLWPLCAPGNE